MTKAAFQALQNETRVLAMQIGLRPAARAMGLAESRVQAWSHRSKWNIAALRPAIETSNAQPSTTTAHEVMHRILGQHRSRTQLGMAQSATKVFEHLAEEQPGALVRPATAIAAQQWSKVADITHGYAAERTAPPVVNVAVVQQPTEEDRIQRRAMHARLDEIARRLTSSTTD